MLDSVLRSRQGMQPDLALACLSPVLQSLLRRASMCQAHDSPNIYVRHHREQPQPSAETPEGLHAPGPFGEGNTPWLLSHFVASTTLTDPMHQPRCGPGSVKASSLLYGGTRGWFELLNLKAREMMGQTREERFHIKICTGLKKKRFSC